MFDKLKNTAEKAIDKALDGAEFVAGECPICALARGIFIGSVLSTLAIWLAS